MPENITQPQSEETAIYLQKLSQSVYNIKMILYVHSEKKQIYDKELSHLYRIETESLIRLLVNPIGVTRFVFKHEVLKADLIDNEYDKPKIIKEIITVKEKIRSLLSKVQVEREKKPGYKASTGLEDGNLRKHILWLVKSGKKIIDEKLLDVEKNTITLKLKKDRLTINKKSGSVKLNKITKRFNPKSRELNVLIKLAENEDNQATFKELLGEIPKNVGNRRQLTSTIKNIKTNLCILPINKQKNRDIFHSVTNVGYKLE